MPGLLYEGGENGRPRRTDRARPGCLPCAWGGYKTITKSVKGIEAERTNGPPKAHAWRVPAPGGGEREGVGRSPRPKQGRNARCGPANGARRQRNADPARSAERRIGRMEAAAKGKRKGPPKGPRGVSPAWHPKLYHKSGKKSIPQKKPRGRRRPERGRRPAPLRGGARPRQPTRRRSRPRATK